MEVDVASQIVAASARRKLGTIYTIRGAAEYLGCSEMHVYRLIARGLLRAVDISLPGAKKTKTRIREDDLAAYIDARTSTA